MTMNFKYHVRYSVINIVPSCGEKRYNWQKKIPAKDKWELPAIIPLMPIVGVNIHLPILHMSKIMVHIYTTDKTVHQFYIGYMINPSLHINKIFKTQVEKCLGCSFSIKIIQSIKTFLMNKNTTVMELIMIYETVGIDIKGV